MSEDHSTVEPSSRTPASEALTPGITPRRTPPAKPTPDFPLRAHATGYWCKKVRGRTIYFGPWDDPEGALRKYLAEKDALESGRVPRREQADVTLKDVVNAYLNAKRNKIEAGELSERSWLEYKSGCDLLLAEFGKRRLAVDLTPADFLGLRKRMAQRFGPVRLGNVIQTIRSIFKFAIDADLLDRPVRFGPDFKKPSKKVLRLHRAQKGPRLFTPAEIHRLLDAASLQMKAMILLGLNAGLGPADCSCLVGSAIDLNTGWLVYPRVKTGVARKAWLWPETIKSIEGALSSRPLPKHPAHADRIFITKYGHAWQSCAISHELRKLLTRLRIGGNRSFYGMRHTFRTVADETRDQPACDAIMGHVRDDMASVYRERVSDSRLRAVCELVRAWLFAEHPGKIDYGPTG